MIAVFIFIGLGLIAYARISKWIRILKGDQKLLDGSNPNEVIMTYIGWGIIITIIVLSMMAK